MSATFSFSRLGKLITKQLFENSRLYIFSVLALIGLFALIFVFWFMAAGPGYDERATYNIYLIGLFLSGTVFASMSFNMLASKDKGTYWLSVPATHLEKLVCTIFYSVIVFTIVYSLCFYSVKLLAISLLKGFIATHPGRSYTTVDISTTDYNSFILYVFCAYFAVQSLYLLGSVYFPRYSFIITTVVSASITFTLVFCIVQIQDNMFSAADWDLVTVKKRDAADNDRYFLYSLPPGVTQTLKYTGLYALTPLFWVVTWFRLKEKQI